MRSTLIIVITFLLLIPVSVTAQSSARTQQDEYSLQKTLQAKKKQRSNQNEESLDFSGTGRPGQQTAGESRGNCASASRLEALLPISKSGTTVQGHPSFWVYFADMLPPGTQVEFIVQNEDREDIWRSLAKLDRQPGYKRFSLPESESALETGQWYRWYVKVYCNSQFASAKYVQGWVKRIPLNSQLYLDLQEATDNSHIIYGNHSIWYDAIDQFLSTYRDNSANLALEQDWQNLMSAKGVDLEQLPSIGSSYEAVDPSNNIPIK